MFHADVQIIRHLPPDPATHVRSRARPCRHRATAVRGRSGTRSQCLVAGPTRTSEDRSRFIAAFRPSKSHQYHELPFSHFLDLVVSPYGLWVHLGTSRVRIGSRLSEEMHRISKCYCIHCKPRLSFSHHHELMKTNREVGIVRPILPHVRRKPSHPLPLIQRIHSSFNLPAADPSLGGIQRASLKATKLLRGRAGASQRTSPGAPTSPCTSQEGIVQIGAEALPHRAEVSRSRESSGERRSRLCPRPKRVSQWPGLPAKSVGGVVWTSRIRLLGCAD